MSFQEQKKSIWDSSSSKSGAIFREAKTDDIAQIHVVRNSVKENTLSNPDLITESDYIEYLTERGKGWVCQLNGKIIGFSIVDLKENNVWALFLKPEFEKQGIGKKLHDMMLDWYFEQTQEPIWLSTTPNTRAETFYRKAGWQKVGNYGKNEMKMEMRRDNKINTASK